MEWHTCRSCRDKEIPLFIQGNYESGMVRCGNLSGSGYVVRTRWENRCQHLQNMRHQDVAVLSKLFRLQGHLVVSHY